MKTRDVKAIVYDFHGTLAFKKRSLASQEVTEVLQSRGHDVGPQEWETAIRFVFFIDNPREKFSDWTEFLERVLEHLRVEPSDSLLLALKDLHLRRNQWELYPETPEVLSTLSVDFESAIGTSIPSFVVLPTLGSLASNFEFIGTRDTTGIAKGSRSFYLTIARELNQEPQHCMFVGDDPLLDIETPHSLGFQTLHLTRRSESPCETAGYHISSLLEMKGIVCR